MLSWSGDIAPAFLNAHGSVPDLFSIRAVGARAPALPRFRLHRAASDLPVAPGDLLVVEWEPSEDRYLRIIVATCNVDPCSLHPSRAFIRHHTDCSQSARIKNGKCRGCHAERFTAGCVVETVSVDAWRLALAREDAGPGTSGVSLAGITRKNLDSLLAARAAVLRLPATPAPLANLEFVRAARGRRIAPMAMASRRAAAGAGALSTPRRREGQDAFRRLLVQRYGGTCMVTGCTLIDVVDAAHLLPHEHGGATTADNGILLRADLHRLFDRGLLGINPTTLAVALAPGVAEAGYAEMVGRTLQVGATPPSPVALRLRWIAFESVCAVLTP